jgi:hypothetical protein
VLAREELKQIEPGRERVLCGWGGGGCSRPGSLEGLLLAGLVRSKEPGGGHGAEDAVQDRGRRQL